MASNMIKVTSLWRYESEKSAEGEYFMGRIGEAYILLFHNQSDHPKAPAFDLCVTPARRTRTPGSYKVKSPPVGAEEEMPTSEEMPEPEPEFNEDLYTDKSPSEGEMEKEDEDTEVPF